MPPNTALAACFRAFFAGCGPVLVVLRLVLLIGDNPAQEQQPPGILPR